MVNESRPQSLGPVNVVPPDARWVRDGLFIVLRAAAISAVFIAVAVAPDHISAEWRMALYGSMDDARLSAASDFLQYLNAVRNDPAAWHATCLIVTGLLAGVVLRVGVARGWAGNLPGAIGVGLFASVMGEWAFGRAGWLVPAEISVASVLAAVVAGVLTLALGHAIARW